MGGGVSHLGDRYYIWTTEIRPIGADPVSRWVHRQLLQITLLPNVNSGKDGCGS